MQDARTSKTKQLVVFVGLVIFAAILGGFSGLLMSLIAPENIFSWAGLAVVPIWLLLDSYFELISDGFGQFGKAVRIVSTLAIVASFYAVFIGFRGFAP
ncbi:hypothetical protein [Arenimonas maotaiensis]|uniref:hypothetical protein n=1 Tax=Arenimonas maotaiensis TaxID=1446479 RepID=UPI001665EACD|nr:hypothetical protein [Arenimonas maotaiensis]